MCEPHKLWFTVHTSQLTMAYSKTGSKLEKTYCMQDMEDAGSTCIRRLPLAHSYHSKARGTVTSEPNCCCLRLFFFPATSSQTEKWSHAKIRLPPFFCVAQNFFNFLSLVTTQFLVVDDLFTLSAYKSAITDRVDFLKSDFIALIFISYIMRSSFRFSTNQISS